MKKSEVIHACCLDQMPKMPENSVDAIVTDPPYEIEIVGRNWDSAGVAFAPGVWIECCRLLKPGGHLLAFGSTRTFHRLVVAIEDAGFDIRDTICWMFGSGFPKSMNVGAAVDQLQGNEREVVEVKNPSPKWVTGEPDEAEIKGGWCNPRAELLVTRGNSPWEGWGTALKPGMELICLARKPLSEKTIAKNVLKWGTGAINIDGCRVPMGDEVNPLHLQHERAERAAQKGKQYKSAYDFYEPDEREGTSVCHTDVKNNYQKASPDQGRWPANVAHDGSDEVEAGMPLVTAATEPEYLLEGKWEGMAGGNTTPSRKTNAPKAKQSASRYYYCAKASRREREEGLQAFNEQPFGFSQGAQAKIKRAEEEDAVKPHHPGPDARERERKRLGKYAMATEGGVGRYDNKKGGVGYSQVNLRKNSHPTVKPLELMKWLCRLITPPDGTVLDPFLGSGTTGIAAAKEGFNFIGIEQSEEYAEIAKARIHHWTRQQELF